MPSGLADRFRFHARSWLAGGAPTYAWLADRTADALEGGDSADGDFRAALRPFHAEDPMRLLPTRLMAAVHLWVLRGEEPELVRFWPSMGGSFPRAEGRGPLWSAFRSAVVARMADLPELLARPIQHNEVGRAVPIAAGFLTVASATGLPLRLLEVGASAGLLLRADLYLERPWMRGVLPVAPDYGPTVAERSGCDLSPVSPFTEDGLTYLQSGVWADLVPNLRMLEEAIEIAVATRASHPVHVDEADGADWLPVMLSEPVKGQATIVFHSAMATWSPPASMRRIEDAIHEAGEYATTGAPLAYLRFEVPDASVEPDRIVQVRLATWPGGEDRLIATCDINGSCGRWSSNVLAGV